MGLFGKKAKPAEAPAESVERDELTGLLGLEKFYVDAAACIRFYAGSSIAICRTSIGNIGAINDTYGWESGNRVLQAAADALASDDSHNIVARDRSKFVTLMRYDTEDELDERIKALHARLEGIGSVLPGNPKVYMNTGVYSTEGRLVDMSVRDMVACAKIAESDASKRTHNSIVRYTEQMSRAVEEDAMMERDMAEALKKKQFVVCLQPKFDMQTGEVLGAKIMSRWLNPNMGVIGSYRYVPLFVKNGFILELDLYLLEQGCEILNRWKKKGLKMIPLSINVPRILVSSQRNMDTYVNIKKKHNIADGLCELEFSERLVDDNVNNIASIFKFFKDKGFRCTVENFGAGNASLSTITDLPLDAVKFSRDYFEDGVISDEESAQLASFIAAAKTVNVTTSATGVTESTVSQLKELGCDILQGGTDSDPLEVEAFEKKYLS